jgi:branched-chain amino acid transport system permease protein
MNIVRESVVGLALAVMLGALAFKGPNADVAIVVLVTAYITLGLTAGVMIGRARLLPACHAAFFGGGAYVVVILTQRWGWSLPVGVVAAAAITAIVALLVAWPAVRRTEGLQFVIVTFAVGELLVQLVNAYPKVTGGSQGQPVTWGIGAHLPFQLQLYRYFGVLLAIVLGLTVLVVAYLRRSIWGLRLAIVGHDANLARSLGMNPNRLKVAVFVATAALAALAGAFYAPAVGFVLPDQMAITMTIRVIGFAIVGGTDSILGAFLGVGLLVGAPYVMDLSPMVQDVLLGGVTVIVLLVEPRGLVMLLRRAFSAVRGWSPRGAHLRPSLVTDSDAS